MSSFIQTAHQTYQTASKFFHKITAPDQTYIKEKSQIEVAHNQNKIVVLIQVLAFFGFLTNILIKNGSFASGVHGLLSTTAITAAFFICSHFRLHPQIFKVIYNLYVVTFGALSVFHGESGILGAWMAVPIFPLLVYFLTGSIGHFLFQIACQVLFLNTFYQGFIKKCLAYMTVEESVEALTYYSHQNVQYTLLFTGLIHYTMQTAFNRVEVAEKKKDDFEKQRNFLLGFSHELRNLINSLMGNVKLAVLENPSEKVKDLLVNAEVCSELLLHLVNNILDTGKVEINDLEINPVPTRVYDTMERIWSVCSELIKRKNLQGRLKIQKDIPQLLRLDHYRITQIFLNLVGNAIKFTDAGCIDVTVEWIRNREKADEKCYEPYPFNDNDDQDEGLFEKSQAFSVFDDKFASLNFSCRKVNRKELPKGVDTQKGVLKITVQDSGCGILNEDLPKLFQRFSQGTSDPSKKKLGTGLGLFITKELCQRMNGDVKVFSKKNRGSAFMFCLPVEPIQNQREIHLDLELSVQKFSHGEQKLKAMVVDDEQFSHFILKDFLNKLNVDVVNVAENGLMACRSFEELEFKKDYVNVVTMDLNMPVMDGKAAAQKIRELEAQKNIEPCLLIIVSGNCSESEIKECLDKNGKIRADAFVKKPVSMDELSRIISSHYLKMNGRDTSKTHF